MVIIDESGGGETAGSAIPIMSLLMTAGAAQGHYWRRHVVLLPQGNVDVTQSRTGLHSAGAGGHKQGLFLNHTAPGRSL
jgi:hypothetical protein